MCTLTFTFCPYCLSTPLNPQHKICDPVAALAQQCTLAYNGLVAPQSAQVPPCASCPGSSSSRAHLLRQAMISPRMHFSETSAPTTASLERRGQRDLVWNWLSVSAGMVYNGRVAVVAPGVHQTWIGYEEWVEVRRERRRWR